MPDGARSFTAFNVFRRGEGGGGRGVVKLSRLRCEEYLCQLKKAFASQMLEPHVDIVGPILLKPIQIVEESVADLKPVEVVFDGACWACGGVLQQICADVILQSTPRTRFRRGKARRKDP